MKNFYIFSGTYSAESYTVIFCAGDSVNKGHLNAELKEYFQKETLPDDIYVVGGNYLETEMQQIFIEEFDDTFLHVNKFANPKLHESINIFSFDNKGELKPLLTRIQRGREFWEQILRDGTARIFIERGGLVESKYSHHFVFPSGKHSEKFLRTGNILLYSPEIYFIAFQLLKYYKPDLHSFIQCDTSSINSVAFALVDLKRRTGETFTSPPINSFKSYSIFEDEEILYGGATLYLISASTSGGIIQRLKERISNVGDGSIVLLYYLGDASGYLTHKAQIVCNLELQKGSNSVGLKIFDTFKGHECRHCKFENSLPINVIGDVFLLESPKVQSVILKMSHAPKWLDRFINEFIPEKSGGKNVLTCYYRDSPDPDERFDLFFDMNEVLDNPGRYAQFSADLETAINSNVPLNTKYIITLDDDASIKLAGIIRDRVAEIQKSSSPVVKFADIHSVLKTDDHGAVIIASSCLVSGVSLSIISKMLRDYPRLSRVYITGLSRTRSEDKIGVIKSSLTKGLQDANAFNVLRQIIIPDTTRYTEWSKEETFLQGMVNYLFQEEQRYQSGTIKYYQDKLEVLRSVDSSNRGLNNDLFYRNAWTSESLKLAKNFAFLSFEAYDRISQTDVYFIISAVLHNLRTKTINSVNLSQSEYLRNILDPENFLRFNDGIIQAAILRACSPLELAYNLDSRVSNDAMDLLGVIFSNSPQSNAAAPEFLYALLTKKMQLRREHFEQILKKVRNLNNEILIAMCDYAVFLEEERQNRRQLMDSSSSIFQDGQIQ